MKYHYEEEVSKDGYKIIKVKKNEKKMYIGSKYNQKIQVEKFIDSCGEFTENDIYIIWGLSFGEHIKELLNNVDKRCSILIIELNEKWVKKIKSEKEFEFLHKNNIKITSTRQEIQEFIQKEVSGIKLKYLKILDYAGYQKIFDVETLKLLKFIRNEANTIGINRNTSLLFAKKWLKCCIQNLKNSYNANSIVDLKNSYKDKPAIIVSAGPSLGKNIGLLKDIKNSLILSGGRTLKPLIENDIKFSCLGVVDPGEISYDLVKNYISDIKVPMLYYEGTNSDIIKNFNYKKIIFTNNSFYNDIWDEGIINLSSGGSIAHSLTEFAIYMGCDPIIFIGQDLAYTGEQTHSEIAYADYCTDKKINNQQKKNIFDLHKREDDIFIEDINGNIVRTSVVLNEFKISFEKIIEKNKNITFIDATEGGAKIKGTKIMTLQKVLEGLKEYELKPVEDLLCDIDKSKEIGEYIKSLYKSFEKYEQLCESAVKATFELEKSYFNQNRLNRELDKLEKIDKSLMECLNEIEIVKDLAYEYSYKIENNEELLIKSTDTKKEKFEKNMKKSRLIYNSIKETIEVTKKYIEDINFS